MERLLNSRITAVLPRIWRLVRAGFALRGPPAMRVLGVGDTDQAERLTAEIIARALRAGVLDDGRALDDHARTVLEAHARLHGGEISTGDVAIDGLAVLDGDVRTDPLDPPLDLDARARAEIIAQVTREVCLDLGAEDRALVAERARGSTRAGAAATLNMVGPLISAREKVIRRKIRHALRAREVRAGDAEIDAALQGDAAAIALAQPTIERLLHRVGTKVDLTPQRSVATRIGWTAAISLLSGGLLALMALNVIPGVEDDPVPRPLFSLECDGLCVPGSTAQIRVGAPRGMRRVAIAVGDELLTDPLGRSFPLPSACQYANAPVGRSFVVSKGTTVVRLIFSKKTLGKSALSRVLAGNAGERGTIVTRSTVTFE